ncbi:DnaJ domain-containing protein [Alloiococcus sp. CFN-8]|uniref:DnaJ domain-containing protein n=1 Tax=Alloiococcus sp. CFN-8 TaxID=3416081 RepID=UPI003CF8D1A6
MAGRMSMEEAYRVLGLNKNATKEEVMKARKELLMKWHPDVAKSSDATRKAQEINEAYAVIKDNNFVYTPSSSGWNTQGNPYGNPYGQRGYGYYQGGNNQNSSQNGYGGQSYNGGGFYRGPFNQGGYQSQGNGQGYYGGFGGARKKTYSPFSFIRSFFFMIILMNLVSGLFSAGRANGNSGFFNGRNNNYTNEAHKAYDGVITDSLEQYNVIIDFSDAVRDGDGYRVEAKDYSSNKNLVLYFDDTTPIAVAPGNERSNIVFMYFEDVIDNLQKNTLYVEDFGRDIYLNKFNYTGSVNVSEATVENGILYYSTRSSKSIWN